MKKLTSEVDMFILIPDPSSNVDNKQSRFIGPVHISRWLKKKVKRENKLYVLTT